VEVTLLLVLVAVVFILFRLSIPYLLPFIIGWFLAVMLLPLVKLLERRGVGRTAAVSTVLASVVLLVLIGSVIAVAAIAREATTLSANMAEYFALLQTWIQAQVAKGQIYLHYLPKNVVSGMESTAFAQLSSIESVFRGFAKFLLDSVTQLPDTLFIAVISIIAAFFMMVNRERMYQSFLGVLPPGWSGKVHLVNQDVMRAFVGTIRVQIVLMLLSAVLGVIGMWILGIPYAVILGLVFGLCGLIPIVGSALLTVPWAIGALVVGDVSLAIKVLLLQAVISLIRHIVEPKILADNVGLDTLSTLFALYVGMKFMGVLGLFLGPIILIGIKSLVKTRLFVDFLPPVDDAHRESEEAAARAVRPENAAVSTNSE
jgi:sporulation integral membrane protein YtvI